MNLPSHIITCSHHPWTYPLMAQHPLIQGRIKCIQTTHNPQISLRLEALAQVIRPDSLKLGSLAWASLWQWQSTKTRLGESSVRLNPNLSPRRRVLQPPATPHDFSLRRATLAWARRSSRNRFESLLLSPRRVLLGWAKIADSLPIHARRTSEHNAKTTICPLPNNPIVYFYKSFIWTDYRPN